MSPRFVLGRENVPCVAEVVNRSLKADCTDFTHIHCATLSLIGSQFTLINSFIPTRALFFRFKQNLIHLFWDVWIFFDSLLFKEGYQL